MEKKETGLTLNEKLAVIQTKFKSKKSRFNSFGKYNFRSAEDILEATKPYLLELSVAVTIKERLLESNFLQFPMLESTATISDNLDSISATAIVGIDLDQKGMQMPQKFGSASSYGKKYALGNLFLIDDTQDPDHGKAEPETKKVLLTPNDPAFDKAMQFIVTGGSIETIKKKYDLSPEASEILSKL
ncbi:MAG: ERF family protein [Flavobacterium sp.]|jgi:hypothetical protein